MPGLALPGAGPENRSDFNRTHPLGLVKKVVSIEVGSFANAFGLLAGGRLAEAQPRPRQTA